MQNVLALITVIAYRQCMFLNLWVPNRYGTIKTFFFHLRSSIFFSNYLRFSQYHWHKCKLTQTQRQKLEQMWGRNVSNLPQQASTLPCEAGAKFNLVGFQISSCGGCLKKINFTCFVHELMTAQALFVSLRKDFFLPLSLQVSTTLFCCRQQHPSLSWNYAMFFLPVEEGRPSKRLALCSQAYFSLAGAGKKVSEMHELM